MQDFWQFIITFLVGYIAGSITARLPPKKLDEPNGPAERRP